MSKKIKIILSILALISIMLSLFVIFKSRLLNEKEIIPQEILEENLPPNKDLPEGENWQPELKSISQEDKNSLIPPVEKKYFENVVMAEENVQVLSFYLDPKTLIKAIFDGKITNVVLDQKPFPNDSSFHEIWLEKTGGDMWASYLIVGDVLVEEGAIINQGDSIATAGEGGMGFRSGTNLSIWLHDKEGEFIELSKEIFD